MRIGISLLVFIYLLSSFKTTGEGLKWMTNYEEAKSIAVQENKTILMSFSGSDWCVNCMKLEKILFESLEFQKFASDHLILLKLDFPSKKKNKLPETQQKHNDDLAEKYNKKGQFPTVILLDGESNVLGKLEHPLNSAQGYISSLKKADELMRLKQFSFLLFVFLLFNGIGQNAYTKDTLLMGSAFSFTAVSENLKEAKEAVYMGIEEVVRIEKLISSWDKNSETTKINNSAGLIPIKVSNELYSLIFRSKKISEISNGYFDISYASMDKVWNFNDSTVHVPSEDEILKSVSKINYENIILNAENQTVFLKDKGMKIGFGSIGKGYAANKAKAVMIKHNIKSGVVNAGGDLIAWGKNKNNKPWSIGIVNPLEKETIALWLEVNNTAIVTSGNYEKYIEINGKKYCHIINPKTGWPATGLLSVTIICENAELADGLATTVFILGVKDGLEIVNHLEAVECVLISSDGAFHYSSSLMQNKIIKDEG